MEETISEGGSEVFNGLLAWKEMDSKYWKRNNTQESQMYSNR